MVDHSAGGEIEFLKYKYGFGLMGRIQYFLMESDPRFLLVAVSAVVLLVMLALLHKRLPLYFGLLICLVFYNCSWRSVDSAAGVCKIALIGLLAAMVVRSRTFPGKPMLMFLMYVLTGLSMTVFASDFRWSMQWGLMLLLVFLVSCTMADYMQRRTDITRLMIMYLIAGAVWTLVGVVSLKDLARAGSGGDRFLGAFETAGSFTDTGGFCVPIFLWGIMRSWSMKWRVLCAVLFIAAQVVLISAGQRTGLFAGFLACMPLLFRMKAKRLAMGGALIGTILVLLLVLSQFNRKQSDFIMKRYFTTDTTHRTDLWSQGFKAILDDAAVIGHGFGSNRRELRYRMERMLTVHNMYLQIWYDTGVMGVVFFALSLVMGGWLMFKMILSTKDPDIQETSRLFLGELIAIAAAGFFGSGASGASALATTLMVTVLTASHRLTEIVKQEGVEQQQMAHWYMQQGWFPPQGLHPSLPGWPARAH